MKNKLFQLAVYFNAVDRRYIQLAYFVFVLGAFLLFPNSPTEGGSGTR